MFVIAFLRKFNIIQYNLSYINKIQPLFYELKSWNFFFRFTRCQSKKGAIFNWSGANLAKMFFQSTPTILALYFYLQIQNDNWKKWNKTWLFMQKRFFSDRNTGREISYWGEWISIWEEKGKMWTWFPLWRKTGRRNLLKTTSKENSF